MVSGPNNIGGIGNIGASQPGSIKPGSTTGGTSFADTLKSSIDDVSKMQQDASKAVDDLTTGKSDNFTGVMSAVEKADMAFKTLLAIRSKLMDAYDEIKGIQV